MNRTDYQAITTNWAATNDRRVDLIIKEEDHGLSVEEAEELNYLQSLAEIRMELNRRRHEKEKHLEVDP